MAIQQLHATAEADAEARLTPLQSVVVVIPALNERQSLPLVLGDLPKVGQVIVVDNGSSDGTPEVAARCGATVVHESRKGYGSACLRGVEVIRQMADREEIFPQIVGFLDGDYSDHPEKLPELLQPILDDRADFVLGSRLLGPREPGAMPPQSTCGNRVACFLLRVLLGAAYTDLGPFRAIGFEHLLLLDMKDRDFGWTVEMQIKAVRHRLRIQEIPVPYRQRIGVSKISGTISGTFKAGVKILYTIAKYAWPRV